VLRGRQPVQNAAMALAIAILTSVYGKVEAKDGRPVHSGGVSALLLRRAGAFCFSRWSKNALWSQRSWP
jgi:hypothetical protein